jgi:RNA polymerase sigma-70 factor (ECF subfamily)
LALGELTDAELVALCQANLPNETRAFRELVRRYDQRVFGTCFRMLGNREDAEGHSQEIFLSVYKNIGQFEGRSSFSTWLYAITLNSCRNALRKRQRRPAISEHPIDELLDLLPSEEPDPEEATVAREERDLVQAALDALDDETRSILILRELDGLAYDEIAEIVGISLSATKMRIHRARLALRTRLNLLLEHSEEQSNA